MCRDGDVSQGDWGPSRDGQRGAYGIVTSSLMMRIIDRYVLRELITPSHSRCCC